jgi:signal transduction histidine kinase
MAMPSALPSAFSRPGSATDVELALLGVLLSADTVRQGATALLAALAPALDDVSAAIGVRDREGLTLQVLAETGTPQSWPARLEPQFALGGQPGVDPGTGTMVVPLRANGRVVGALLMGDTSQASSLLRAGNLRTSLNTVASVLHVLASRSDAELRRRAFALRSMDSIIDGMAHQIANPLTGASAIAQLLVEDLPDDGHRAAVRQIRHELSRAFTVLSDILDFHRDTHAHDGILDLNVVVERILRFRGYAIREMGIALDVQMGAGFMPVRADARGLEHALLIALRHAEIESHGTVNRAIAVRVCEREQGGMSVEIRDSGAGNVPELTASYFDLPLMRAEDPVREGIDKPDLGLADSILRGCGGRLHVTGSKADGTTLVLVLPRANTHPPQSQPPSPSKSRMPA